jgi:hypothetical protein
MQRQRRHHRHGRRARRQPRQLGHLRLLCMAELGGATQRWRWCSSRHLATAPADWPSPPEVTVTGGACTCSVALPTSSMSSLAVRLRFIPRRPLRQPRCSAWLRRTLSHSMFDGPFQPQAQVGASMHRILNRLVIFPCAVILLCCACKATTEPRAQKGWSCCAIGLEPVCHRFATSNHPQPGKVRPCRKLLSTESMRR